MPIFHGNRLHRRPSRRIPEFVMVFEASGCLGGQSHLAFLDRFVGTGRVGVFKDFSIARGKPLRVLSAGSPEDCFSCGRFLTGESVVHVIWRF
jgi:hypothetical protein